MNKGGKMKSEKGITLLSITIYIMLLTLAVALFATVRTNFYKNVRLITDKGIYASEFNKANGFFVQDAKRNYNVACIVNRDEANNEQPHTGTSEQKPVAAFKFGNNNIYLYYGNTEKGTVFGKNSEGESYEYLNQGLFKYTNQGRTLKIAGGVSDFSVNVRKYGPKKILEIGMEIGDGKIFTNMENPIRYTLKYW